MPRRSLWPPLAALALVGLAALLFSVTLGSAALSLGDVWAVARGEGSPLARTLILDLRIPRSLSAFAVGGLLAVAGALMQVLLRNPWPTPTCWASPAAPRWGRWRRCWRGWAGR